MVLMKNRLPNSGVVRVLKVSDKVKCKHKNLVEYCIRDGFKYWFCMDCGNVIREPLS